MGILTEIFSHPLNRSGIKGDFLLPAQPGAEPAPESLGAMTPGDLPSTTDYRPQTGFQPRRKRAQEGAWTPGINGAPRFVLEDVAVDIAAAQTNTMPTEAQKKSGRYEKGVVKIHGLEIHVENPKGSFREGTDPNGNHWRQELHAHYGYVQKVNGKTAPDAVDGDKTDVFLGEHPEAELVFVVDQFKSDGTYDEPKTMIGWLTESDARDGYLANYQDGWKCGPITALTVDQFRAWLKSGNRGPVSKYKPLLRAAESVPDPMLSVLESAGSVDEARRMIAEISRKEFRATDEYQSEGATMIAETFDSEKHPKGEDGRFVYHASHKQFDALSPREVKTYNSLGTWFTSTPEHAKRLYGPNVHRAELPSDLKLIEFRGEDQNDFKRLLAGNAKVARESGHEKEAKILDKTLPDENMEQQYDRDMNADMPYFDLKRKYPNIEAVRKANKAAHTLLLSEKYNKAFRKMLEGFGYQGIVWRGSSIDQRPDEPHHDVYVVFHDKDIPVEKV